MDEQPRLEEYKKLIFKREKLRKDAWQFGIEYIKEFGELLEREYTLKIECIKLKKTIAFCQSRQNRGETVSRDELDSYIETTMKDYYEELEIISTVRNTDGTHMAEIDYYKLKKLYRKLVTMLHPDLHPTLFEHEEIAELWDRVTAAYENNDYEELQALEVIVVEKLLQYEESEQQITVENIDAKIAVLRVDIDNIIHNDPYRYKELLRDDDAITEKKTDLQNSITEYEEYLIELQTEWEKYKVEEFA